MAVVSFAVLLAACGGGGGGSTPFEGAAKAAHRTTASPAGAFIKSFTVTQPAVRPGARTIVRVSAGDDDDGALTYAWRAEAGALGPHDANPVIWTAPESEGTYLISVEVTNAAGLRSRGTTGVVVTNRTADPLIMSVSPMGY